MAWTADGMVLALGLYDGSVSLRDKAGTEKLKFAASSSPVWSLAWSPGVRQPGLLAADMYSLKTAAAMAAAGVLAQ
jgi:WD40 repeat protein